jgi:hypothetical protein
MAAPTAFEPLVNQVIGKIKWAGVHIVDLAALGLICAAMAPAFGLHLPGVRPLSWTECAYAMGAYWLFRARF